MKIAAFLCCLAAFVAASAGGIHASANDVAHRRLQGIPNANGNPATPAPTTPPSPPSPPGPPSTTVPPVLNTAFIVNQGANTITRCTVTNGVITACTNPIVTFRLTGPSGIALANNIAYIPNFNTNQVTQCTVVVVNGLTTIGTCQIPMINGLWGLNNPWGLAIWNNFAIIPNQGDNTITSCLIDNAGNIAQCTNFINNILLQQPRGLGIVQNTAFVVNQAGASVSECIINNGQVTTCAINTPQGGFKLTNPTGIAIQNNLAYIPNAQAMASTVTVCTIGAGPSITGCLIPGVAVWRLNNPQGIAVLNAKAYVLNGDSTVTECDLSGATISACALSMNTAGLNLPVAATVF